ncbi:FadR/GntR family transcriptional regulator [Tsukamurella tyrosinosolvens]|uniref:FadR/GntR family transcriptional regulator n=1 Tax=Tsukamurella tyrosinosolvens TaxID=57704 RepID=UPI002DD420AB|nr:FadR/GntR family transcriptional regulator [Tsukamurella tyrosinosolvens]MEC4613279.1 FadR/GntR family transcriptional regulator [Tsukamurella tyrosinosolvens]
MTLDPPEWRPVARTRTYQLVISAIEEQILGGTLRVGDALPAERDLAARLEVSRPAVREALRVLEAQGVVTSGTGSGPRAGTFVSAMPADSLAHFLRLHMALTNFEFPEIVEARVLLERSSVSLAARDADAAALAPVRAALAAMDTAGEDRAAFNDADTDFHTAIAEACGNRLVTTVTVAIRGALRAGILAAFEEIEDWPALTAVLQQEHRAILAAIESGDAERAAELTETHIRGAYRRLPGLHSGTIV